MRAISSLLLFMAPCQSFLGPGRSSSTISSPPRLLSRVLQSPLPPIGTTTRSSGTTIKLPSCGGAPSLLLLSSSSSSSPSSPSTPSAAAQRYQSLWQGLLSVIEARIPGLQPYAFPEDLRVREGAMVIKDKTMAVTSRTYAYCLPDVLRQIRVLVMTTSDAASPQVINFVIFPDPRLPLPIFGADCVTLPGGDLIALDFHPTVPQLNEAYLDMFYSRLRTVHAKYQDRLAALGAGGGEIPEAAIRFFSPYHLFARLNGDDAESQALCEQAMMEYLDAYLDLVTAATPARGEEGGVAVERGQGAATTIRDAHVAYSKYRLEKDPARGMLKRLFGEEYTEHVLRDLLFDLAGGGAEEGGAE